VALRGSLLISVVIPAFNEEKYIKFCLLSLRNQSADGHEVIVVDGGSTDRTVSIAEEFADRVIVEAVTPVGAARNLGAKYAKGDIVAFMDADTIASRGWINAIRDSTNKNGVVGVTGPTLPIGGSDLDRLLYRVCTDHIQRFLIVLKLPHVPGFNCAYRKDALLSVGGFDESRVTHEDMLLSMDLKEIGRITYNPEMLAFTSLRRVDRYGYDRIVPLYVSNFFLTLLFGKSCKNYNPIR